MGYILNTINPAYELVSDVVVGTATTTVDFTGLSFDKTDDIMMVGNIINNIGGEVNYWLRFNNNNTNTNYYSQVIIADSTSTSGARVSIPRIIDVNAGKTGFFNTKIKLTNNGYGVYQSNTFRQLDSSISIRNWFGTSTFTMTSITQLSITGDTASSIGAGSRFQLYKRKAHIVADVIVSTATTSVDITGLSIDKGSEYMLVSDVVNPTSSSRDYALFINNNTTATNYYRQTIVAGSTSVSSERNNNANAYYAGASSKQFAISKIKLTNNGYIVSQNDTSLDYGGSNIRIVNVYITSTFTASNITQLTITASATNAIGIGSRFQLIKLK